MATSFESGHTDMVHDAQLDYYGRRLATCSSDKTIKIFDIVADQQHLADLRGHEGPVWQVCWAHPKYGSVLASCSFDHRVIVWREVQDNQWQQVGWGNSTSRKAGFLPPLRPSLPVLLWLKQAKLWREEGVNGLFCRLSLTQASLP